MTNSRSIIELKRKALALNLCGTYKERWDRAETDKDLIDIATDINGADFMCAAAQNGWGLTEQILTTRFAPFINGRDKSFHNGYSSSMYCAYMSDIIVGTTILIVMYSSCKIIVPESSVCKLFLSKNTKIQIQNNGIAEVICYDADEPVITGNGKTYMTSPSGQDDSWVNF